MSTALNSFGPQSTGLGEFSKALANLSFLPADSWFTGASSLEAPCSTAATPPTQALYCRQ
jgi:hypothetical protein